MVKENKKTDEVSVNFERMERINSTWFSKSTESRNVTVKKMIQLFPSFFPKILKMHGVLRNMLLDKYTNLNKWFNLLEENKPQNSFQTTVSCYKYFSLLLWP